MINDEDEQFQIAIYTLPKFCQNHQWFLTWSEDVFSPREYL